MWSGDIDAEYADDGHVVLERLVGSINVGLIALPDAEGNFVMPTVRMGILAVEEVEDLTTYPAPSLFVREDIEEYSWLWMHEFNATEGAWVTTADFAPGNNGVRAGRHLDIDLRVKRKLSKKDHLVLLTERAVPFEFGTTAADYTYLLRGLFSTK